MKKKKEEKEKKEPYSEMYTTGPSYSLYSNWVSLILV